MNKDKCLNIFERYVSGTASSDEIAELISFLENDPQLNKWLEIQIMAVSNEIDSGIKMRMLNNIRSQTNNYNASTTEPNRKNKPLFFYLKRIVSVASIILLPLVITLAVYLYQKPVSAEFEVTADMGEKASLTLPEGTKVSVNSGSKVIYSSDYSLKERLVHLNGEAFFDVKHDSQKPFVVQCKDVKVMVLGTSFGIKAYDNESNISIVLNTGKIQLITPKEEIEMKPNHRVVYNKATQETQIREVNAEDYTDWRKNRLRFEDESLETIMKSISRMHNIDIIFEDPNLQNQRFTGTVDNTNINSVLDAIKLTSSVKYRMKEGTVYLY